MWADCRRYGFISAGQGRWYSLPFRNHLTPDIRVFAYQPGCGYVGVGLVTEAARRVADFTVIIQGRRTPLLSAPLSAQRMGEHADDPELSEYPVRVEWLTTREFRDAIWEPGMRAYRNTACTLRDPFTLARLVEKFGLPA
jgi:hypothetical protein